MSLLCVRGAQVVVSSGVTTTLAGLAHNSVDFDPLEGMAVSPDGLNLFVADRGTSIRQVRVHV